MDDKPIEQPKEPTTTLYDFKKEQCPVCGTKGNLLEDAEFKKVSPGGQMAFMITGPPNLLGNFAPAINVCICPNCGAFYANKGMKLPVTFQMQPSTMNSGGRSRPF